MRLASRAHLHAPLVKHAVTQRSRDRDSKPQGFHAVLPDLAPFRRDIMEESRGIILADGGPLQRARLLARHADLKNEKLSRSRRPGERSPRPPLLEEPRRQDVPPDGELPILAEEPEPGRISLAISRPDSRLDARLHGLERRIGRYRDLPGHGRNIIIQGPGFRSGGQRNETNCEAHSFPLLKARIIPQPEGKSKAHKPLSPSGGRAGLRDSTSIRPGRPQGDRRSDNQPPRRPQRNRREPRVFRRKSGRPD